MANQPAKASTGQQYGKATEQLESQEMIPLPQNVEPSVRPGSAGPLLRPTEFPNQPVSAPMSDNPIADRDSGDDTTIDSYQIMKISGDKQPVDPPPTPKFRTKSRGGSTGPPSRKISEIPQF